MLEELHALILLEARWRAEYRDQWLYQIQVYERGYLELYWEPYRLSVTWISNFDTTAGRAFLNRKE